MGYLSFAYLEPFGKMPLAVSLYPRRLWPFWGVHRVLLSLPILRNADFVPLDASQVRIVQFLRYRDHSCILPVVGRVRLIDRQHLSYGGSGLNQSVLEQVPGHRGKLG